MYKQFQGRELEAYEKGECNISRNDVLYWVELLEIVYRRNLEGYSREGYLEDLYYETGAYVLMYYAVSSDSVRLGETSDEGHKK